MIGMRKFVGFLMALAFAAFALPANADGGDEKFTLVMAPANVSGGPQSITATLATQVGDDDRIRSFKLITPPGVTQLSVTSTSPAISPLNILVVQATATAAGSVSVKNVNLGRSNRTIVLTLGVTYPPAGCAPAIYTWNAKAWEDSNYSGGPFAGPVAGSQLTTTVAGGVCTFSLTGDTTVAAGSASATVNMTLTNNAPATGPAITAITLTPPSGVTLVNPANGIINVPNLGGGASTQISVTVSTLPSCTGSGPASWSVASVTPATFTQIGTNPKNNITAQACSMSISAPTSAAVNNAFPVTVGLTSGPGGANVTLTSNCQVTGPIPAVPSGYSAAFTATAATVGSCTFNATANQGYPAAAPLTIPVYAIPAVACGNTPVTSPGGGTIDPNKPYVDLATTTTGQWGLLRGNNSDGTGCTPVNATFTLDTVNKVSNLTYDKAAGGTNGVFKYTIVWPEVAVDPSTPPPALTASWTDFRPLLSWGFDKPDASQYVPALACVDELLSLGEGLLPFIPDVAPFTNNPYPQYRPLDAYSQPQKARMCVAQHAWTSNQTLSGTIQVIYWDKVVDEGDGFVKGPSGSN